MMADNEGMKTIMLDEIAEVQKTLSKDDVSIKDLAKALSFFIRISMPNIESSYITDKQLEYRLGRFRESCPVHSQYIKDKEALESIPMVRLFKILSRQLGWIVAGITLIFVWLWKIGIISF